MAYWQSSSPGDLIGMLVIVLSFPQPAARVCEFVRAYGMYRQGGPQQPQGYFWYPRVQSQGSKAVEPVQEPI